MMYSNKILIQLSGVSSKTYYRRLNEVKDFEKSRKLMIEDKALQIAKILGCEAEFKKYISQQNKKNI